MPYFDPSLFYGGVPDPAPVVKEVRPLRDVLAGGINASPGLGTGRRMRTFATCLYKSVTNIGKIHYRANAIPWEGAIETDEPVTFGVLWELAVADEHLSLVLQRLPLRTGPVRPLLDSIQDRVDIDNPSLVIQLQDLGYEIIEDIREAMDTLNGAAYAGVDEGIEPVPDEHVALAIWGMQRELNREKRGLPAAPLSALSWDVQRALVERRRLRFAQWGIGHEEWTANQWSVLDVPEDTDWLPRRELRLSE